MKIGQIGLGQITEVHRDGYRRFGLEVVAGTDISPQVRARTAGNEPEMAVHETLEALLADERVDVLDVAAPHRADIRGPLLEKVLVAGKPVLLQKPFAHHYSDALAYTELAAKNGTTLMINQNSLFAGGVVERAAALANGELIGRPFWGRVRHTMYFDPGDHPWYGKGDRWWMTDMAVHELALLHHLVGPPQSVFASIGRDVEQKGVEGDGFVQAIFRYADGLSVVINEGGIYNGPVANDYLIELQGGAGGISINPGKRAMLTPRRGEREDLRTIYRWFPEAFGLAMHHFIFNLQNASTPWALAEDNLYVLAVIEASYRSAAEGRVVELREIMGDRWQDNYGPGVNRGGAGWTPPLPVEAKLQRDYTWATL